MPEFNLTDTIKTTEDALNELNSQINDGQAFDWLISRPWITREQVDTLTRQMHTYFAEFDEVARPLLPEAYEYADSYGSMPTVTERLEVTLQMWDETHV